MKILIIGFGSIGKRHYENLLQLGFQQISFVRRNNEEVGDHPVYSSISTACKQETFTHAIIAVPTTLHAERFTELLNCGIPNIYIEKPVCESLEKASEMKKLTEDKAINTVVGFDLHFDPGLLKVKELIDDGALGKPISFQIEVGQYLPDWRPYEDHRLGMSAKKELGGGVMLDLVHEFDYLNWLLGPVKAVRGINRKVASLEIETEAVSISILETASGAVGSIYLDYLQQELARSCKIICDGGTLVWDYAEAQVRWITFDQPQWQSYSYSDFSRNDRFLAIMQAFMNSDQSPDDRLTTLSEGIRSLQIVEAAKTADKQHKRIAL